MKKKILKRILIILFFILLILLCILGVYEFKKYKYKKILIDNNSLNYEIIQTVDGVVEQTTKLYDNTLLIDDGENIIWLDKKSNKSIVINKTLKTAIVTDETDISIASLNETYIKEYFENEDCIFKFKGKENNFALLEFTNKAIGITTTLYLNLDNNLIEKEIIKNGIGESVIEYEVELNSISEEDIKEPDLTDYKIMKQ